MNQLYTQLSHLQTTLGKRAMTHSTGREYVRRSSRVLVSLPLSVSGDTSDGLHVNGAAETVVVNRHGAKIRSSVHLETRMDLRISLLEPYKWRAARVVWADPRHREYGIELHRPENFWGIYFPPDDWEAHLASVVAKEESSAGAPNTAPERRYREIRIPKEGVMVTLRGDPAAAVPFQERGLLTPVSDHYGTMSVARVVGLSSKVSVIFGKDLVEGAAITAIAYGQESGQCRIWLQFARPLYTV